MDKIKLAVLIISCIVALFTILIGVKQPTMHKQAMFTDEYHEFVEEEMPTSNMGISNTNIPTKNTTNNNSTTSQPQRKKIIKQIIKYTEPETTTQPNTTKQKANTQTIKKQTVVQPQKTNNTATQQPQKQYTNIPQTKNTQKVLTEREEIIAWNRWRSALQNQVMKDSHMCAPLGTVFKFSFTVDKFGNMSNIKVWSTNPSYTSYAVRCIKPVLSSYQHKAILNFPEGTKRVITNVNGGFVISTRTEYSSPSDYSDYEKVKRSY